MDVENRQGSEIKTNVNSLVEESLSLYTIIGQDRIIEILRNIIFSYFADKEVGRNTQYPSVLFCGSPGSGRRTIGKAMVNSLGCTYVRECLGKTLGMGGEAFADYFDPVEDMALFVNGGGSLSRFAQETFYKLLTTNKIYIPDIITRTRQDVVFETKPLVIFTAEKLSGLFPELYEVFDLHLILEEYSTREIFLILQQRIKYCGWKYESDEVLKIIAQNSQGNVGRSMKILQMSYCAMRSGDESLLRGRHVEKAVRLLKHKKSSEPHS